MSVLTSTRRGFRKTRQSKSSVTRKIEAASRFPQQNDLKAIFFSYLTRVSDKVGGRLEPKIAQLLREDSTTSRTVRLPQFKGPCLTRSAGSEDNRAKPLRTKGGEHWCKTQDFLIGFAIFWYKFEENEDLATIRLLTWTGKLTYGKILHVDTFVLDGTLGRASRGPSLFTDVTSGHALRVRNTSKAGIWLSS